MEWRAEGYVLAVRTHGEHDAILDVLTAQHGRVSGYVKGGSGKRLGAVLQVGNKLDLVWRSRLADALGRFSVELIESHMGELLTKRTALAGLSSMAAILASSLPEREPYPNIYAAFERTLPLILEGDAQAMVNALVRFELGLLTELGYGLDLKVCAATGKSDDLCFVSPKTGRAVSAAAGEPYKDRLLPLPSFLAPGAGQENVAIAELLAGLELTDYFLSRHIWSVTSRKAPQARVRLAEHIKTLASCDKSP